MIEQLLKFLIKLENLFARRIPKEAYFSQYGQDKYVADIIFSKKKGGTFVDIGAHDGVTFSNSYYFEKELGWTGIAVEPIPEVFEKLSKNRKCVVVNGCVSNFSGEVEFLQLEGEAEMLSGIVDSYHGDHTKRISDELDNYGGSRKIIKAKCFTLLELLQKNNIEHVDFITIDTEGNELDILKSINFDRISIGAITVENNYKDYQIRSLLRRNGFKLVARAGSDEIFRNDENISQSQSV